VYSYELSLEIRGFALDTLSSASDLTFINTNRNLITYGALTYNPHRNVWMIQ
jgi:hypothetical protein